MSIKLDLPKLTDLKPRITVIGVGGAGCNAINNMIAAGLEGVEFVVANTDAQALSASSSEARIQLGTNLTEGLGAGSKPEIGEAAAEEAVDDIRSRLMGTHMLFIAAGMGGGTGTGAASVIARVARELGVLTVAVVTKPFHFEGSRRYRIAEAGIAELRKHVDTLIVIPNQNLFRIANEKTTFAEAFILADQVLYSGIACIVDLIVKEGLINLDLADVRTVLTGMGTAMMGTGEAAGDRRAITAAEEAISNPLLDDVSLRGAKGLLLSIIGGRNLTLYEVDEAASRVRQEVDPEANIIVGATFDESLGDRVRVSIVASGLSRTEARAAAQAAGAQGVPMQPGDRSKAPAAPQQAPAQAAARAPNGAPQAPAQARGAPGAPTAPSGPAPQAGQAGPARPANQQKGPPPVPQAPRPQAGPPPIPAKAADAPPRTWHGPGEVTIEERPPLFSEPNPAESLSAGKPVSAPESPLAPNPGTFTPQSPVEVRRPQKRMPDIEDFPDVGQREYRAKAPAAAPKEAGAEPPRVYQQAAEPAPKKGSLFQRLIGSSRPKASATDERSGSTDKAELPDFFDQGKRTG
ncbi:MAG: cell division protein FtsZ [Hyphomicrobiales bacterium]|nr:cell division protein FtsZ [Hyphomicrobiales bacterium]